MNSIAVLVVVAMALGACRKSAPPPDPPRTGGIPFDERQACSVDGDCVAVEIECCDHCNGGTVVGVYRDHAADVRTTYAPPSECEGATCTERACLDEPVPFCWRGICGVRVGTQEDVPPLPPP